MQHTSGVITGHRFVKPTNRMVCIRSDCQRSSLVIDLDDRAEHTLNKFADDKTERST